MRSSAAQQHPWMQQTFIRGRASDEPPWRSIRPELGCAATVAQARGSRRRPGVRCVSTRRVAEMGTEGSSSGGARAPGERSFWTFWTTLPGVLTGVAALVTAIVGAVTLVHSLGGSAPSGQSAASTSGTTSGFVSAPATSVSASSASGGAPVATIRGRLTMVPGEEADLETGRVGNAVPNADLSLLGDGVGGHVYELTSLGGSLAPFSGGAADRATCTAALNAHSDTYEYLSQLSASSQLCVQTSENHVAALHVISLPGPGVSQFVYTYTVWQ